MLWYYLQLSSPPFPTLHCSPFGVIPKKGQPGKWRFILDLSSLQGHSVIDGIPKDPFSSQDVSVDIAIARLLELGPGTLMTKFDVECAYRNIALQPGNLYLFVVAQVVFRRSCTCTTAVGSRYLYFRGRYGGVDSQG